jgi:hypothetical protein
MKTKEQPERRRRSIFITPGEAKRPGAAMKYLYVPPAIAVASVSLESFLLDTITPTIEGGSPQYSTYDEETTEIKAGDIWFD